MARIEQIIKEINGVETEIYPVTIHQSVVDESNNETLDVTLAKKATHGYGEGETPKTLKQVDDDKAAHGYTEAENVKTLKEVETLKASHGYESNPKTLKQVDDEVIQLAGDVSVKMTNLLQNSSFENGVISPVRTYDSNGVASTLSINAINPISGNYDARLELTTPSSSNNRPILYLNGLYDGWVLNHVFYFGMSVKVNSGIPTIFGVYNGGGLNTLGLTLKDGFNSWAVECLGLSNFGYVYLDGRTLWDFNFDNIIAYDLTAIFGEGNEPTKEEMDLLISTLGIDYFEGEITIPAQKIMQWQLKLIRKNKNAIIALGGTII